MALRRRLSSGLPLSDIVLHVYYITARIILALQKLIKLIYLSFTIYEMSVPVCVCKHHRLCSLSIDDCRRTCLY